MADAFPEDQDIETAIELAISIAESSMKVENSVMVEFFRANHRIRLYDRREQRQVACIIDPNDHRCWYFNGKFVQKNSRTTKWYPAAIVARMKYPRLIRPVLDNAKIIGYHVPTADEGGFQFSPGFEIFTVADLETLLTKHVGHDDRSKANTLLNLLCNRSFRITAAPHRSSSDTKIHITIDAALPEGEGQIHVVLINKSSDRPNNTGFKWSGFNLVFKDSRTDVRSIR